MQTRLILLVKRGEQTVGQALYRKYRSKDLNEIVGQDPIVAALSNALKSGKISHAYLFTGPRGVGKTSVARILAHQINGIDYVSDQMPIDIIEIDAASNRRIDEIRDLREKVLIAPVSSKYKVYIIDEVHMLTREAFNALLKTLEEPPAHVIFILATTEAHKLPETIVSRTQKYNFRLASSEEVVKLLGGIAKKEKIKISDEALKIIAEHSGGSLRDAVSLLDQIRHSGEEISADIVRQNLGLPAKQAVGDLIESLCEKDPKKILNNLKEAYQNGVNANLLADQLVLEIRNQIANGDLKISEDIALKLMQDLLQVSSYQQAETRLEIALIKCQLECSSQPKTVKLAIDNNLQPPLTTSKPITKNQKTELPIISTGNKTVSKELWLAALNNLKNTHNTLFSILKTATIEIDDSNNILTLKFSRQFYLNRAKDTSNKKALLKSLDEAGASDCQIEYELTDVKITKSEGSDTVRHLDNVKNIANVFGGAEVLE